MASLRVLLVASLELIFVGLHCTPSAYAARFDAADQISPPLDSYADGSSFGSVVACAPDRGANHDHLLITSPSADRNRVMSYDIDTLMKEQILQNDGAFGDEFSDRNELAVHPSGSLVAVFSPSTMIVHLYERSYDHTFVPSVSAPMLNVTESLSMLWNSSSSPSFYDCFGSSMTISASYLALKCVEAFEVEADDEFDTVEFEDFDFTLIYEMSELGTFSDEVFTRVYARATQSDEGSVRSISISDDLLVMADEFGGVIIFNKEAMSHHSSPTEYQWSYTQTLAPPADLSSSLSDVATSVHILSLGDRAALAQVVSSSDVLSVSLWDTIADGSTSMTFFTVAVSKAVSFDGYGFDTPDISVSMTDSQIAVGVASPGAYFVELFDFARDEDTGKLSLAQPRDEESGEAVSRVVEPSASDASGDPAERYFGTSVSFCTRNGGERVLVVGAPSSTGTEDGAVYVFAETDGEDPFNADASTPTDSVDAETSAEFATFENDTSQTRSPFDDATSSTDDEAGSSSDDDASFTNDIDANSSLGENGADSTSSFNDGMSSNSDENGTADGQLFPTTNSFGGRDRGQTFYPNPYDTDDPTDEASSTSDDVTSPDDGAFSTPDNEAFPTSDDAVFSTSDDAPFFTSNDAVSSTEDGAASSTEDDAPFFTSDDGGSSSTGDDAASSSQDDASFTKTTIGDDDEAGVRSTDSDTSSTESGDVESTNEEFPGGDTSSALSSTVNSDPYDPYTKYPVDESTSEEATTENPTTTTTTTTTTEPDSDSNATSEEYTEATSPDFSMNGTFVGNDQIHGGGTGAPAVVDGEDVGGRHMGWKNEDIVIVFGMLFFAGVFASMFCMCYRKCANQNRYVGLDAPSAGAGYVPPAPRRGSRARGGGRRNSYSELQSLSGSQHGALPL